MIPFVGLLLSLNKNLHALVSTKIIGVRIHERGLTHVMKLMGNTEPNVQQKAKQKFASH
jgi:hypothetical protein